jgi:Zn-finger nucleic acid-binding protein
MNCPACDHPLTPIHAGQITVDACEGGCGGIWFDNFELKRVDEPGEIEGEALLNIEFDLGITVDYQRRRSCPKCEGVVLMRHFFNATRRVEVDTCPKCGGVWLDAGELAQIRKESPSKADRQQAAGQYFKQVFAQDFMRTPGRGPGPAAPGS